MLSAYATSLTKWLAMLSWVSFSHLELHCVHRRSKGLDRIAIALWPCKWLQSTQDNDTLQEELMEEGAGVPAAPPAASAMVPSTPSSSSTARDPNPWQASWGDLFSSQEDSSENLEQQPQSDHLLSSSSSRNLRQDESVSSSNNLQVGDSQQPVSSLLVSGASGAVAPASVTAASKQASSYIREETDYSKWSVLREGDGGRHVHELQVALMEHGFWAGDDDMQWWQFGDATCSAVQSFQVRHLSLLSAVLLPARIVVM